MKRKYYFVILFLVLAIFLSGCGGIVTPATDEAEIKSIINEYFLALNDQNWSKAKGYCVYESDQYYSTCGFEDAVNVLEQEYGIVTVTCFANISNVSVNGSYASAFISINLLGTFGYGSESDSISGYYYLQKTGNNWKIYDGVSWFHWV